MTNNDDKQTEATISPSYALGQLVKALSTKGEQAAKRVQQWQAVISGMLDGSLNIGSRTPVAGTPVWATLEVAHGGFATGTLAAGGGLRPHEIAKLATVITHELDGAGRDEMDRVETARTVLNAHYVTEEGLAELNRLLENGCYRVDAPEEAALLVSAWLLQQNERPRADQLNATIAPYFDRLRFYPRSNARPLTPLVGDTAYVQTAAECAAKLRGRPQQEQVLRMKEALKYWTPLYDRLIQLFMDRVGLDATSAAATEAAASDARFAAEWQTRAKAWLYDYQQACRFATLCSKHKKKKENFARLRCFLEKAVEDFAQLTPADRNNIRRILNAHVTAHGVPGGEKFQATRAMQKELLARPLHRDFAEVLAARLDKESPDEGVADLMNVQGPLYGDEAARIAAKPRTRVPAALIKRINRCKVAPLPVLLKERIIGSTEAMAAVLPLLTARSAVAAISDAKLAGLVNSTYRAFRQRRSLLLVNLESQARFEELPWISAVMPWAKSSEHSQAAARAALTQAATLTIGEFPQTTIPNKLVKELRSLAKAGDVELTLVDELAADIFMGTFSLNFLYAAQEAAQLLQGTLYERYYGIDYAGILRIYGTENKWNKITCPDFDKLCFERSIARPTGRGNVAANGTVIEQAQILTTHNLAGLWHSLKWAERSNVDLAGAARGCFTWICRRLQTKLPDWRTELQTIKNCAYAWRQMLFYISLLPDEELTKFIAWVRKHFEQQPADFRARFAPAVNGLLAIADGESFQSDGTHASGGCRFLGWSTERHWLRHESAASTDNR